MTIEKKAVGVTALALSILSVVGVALFETAPLWAPFLIASGPIGWTVAAVITVGFVVAVGMISLVASDVFAGKKDVPMPSSNIPENIEKELSLDLDEVPPLDEKTKNDLTEKLTSLKKAHDELFKLRQAERGLDAHLNSLVFYILSTTEEFKGKFCLNSETNIWEFNGEEVYDLMGVMGAALGETEKQLIKEKLEANPEYTATKERKIKNEGEQRLVSR